MKQPLTQAVTDTIGKLALTDQDAALVKLASMYADAIDRTSPDWQSDVLNRLGPKLLAALVELGATPKARAALKADKQAVVSSQLSALRSTRSA